MRTGVGWEKESSHEQGGSCSGVFQDKPQYYYCLISLIWHWSFQPILHRYIPWQDIAANRSFGGAWSGKRGVRGYMDGRGGMIACDENEGITVAFFGHVLTLERDCRRGTLMIVPADESTYALAWKQTGEEADNLGHGQLTAKSAKYTPTFFVQKNASCRSEFALSVSSSTSTSHPSSKMPSPFTCPCKCTDQPRVHPGLPGQMTESLASPVPVSDPNKTRPEPKLAPGTFFHPNHHGGTC